MNCKFTANDREYELKVDNCIGILNDEEKPVEGLDVEKVLSLLNEGVEIGEEVRFDLEYYDVPCESCESEKSKYYGFLEYYFYIFTKEGNYVTSSLSRDYENTCFRKLVKANKVDESYIVTLIVCKDCGNYEISIEQCEV